LFHGCAPSLAEDSAEDVGWGTAKTASISGRVEIEKERERETVR
jgi:hypothetical protein